MSIKKFALAAVLAAVASPALADNCSVVVESNDMMQFNTKEIVVSKACTEFTIELKHVGQLPKAAMGHNIVITKQADMQAAGNDGIAAGLDNDYVKPDDERVLAYTKLIGGGETDTVKFSTEKFEKDGAYEFFCSFPGHSAIMKGVVKVTD